jgi:hypothetical protein
VAAAEYFVALEWMGVLVREEVMAATHQDAAQLIVFPCAPI